MLHSFSNPAEATGDRHDLYGERAEEAERMAARASTPIEREAYERIAKGWRDLEAGVKARLKRGV